MICSTALRVRLQYLVLEMAFRLQRREQNRKLYTT